MVWWIGSGLQSVGVRSSIQGDVMKYDPEYTKKLQRQGHTIKEISKILGCTEVTVRNHLKKKSPKPKPLVVKQKPNVMTSGGEDYYILDESHPIYISHGLKYLHKSKLDSLTSAPHFLIGKNLDFDVMDAIIKYTELKVGQKTTLPAEYVDKQIAQLDKEQFAFIKMDVEITNEDIAEALAMCKKDGGLAYEMRSVMISESNMKFHKDKMKAIQKRIEKIEDMIDDMRDEKIIDNAFGRIDRYEKLIIDHSSKMLNCKKDWDMRREFLVKKVVKIEKPKEEIVEVEDEKIERGRFGGNVNVFITEKEKEKKEIVIHEA